MFFSEFLRSLVAVPRSLQPSSSYCVGITGANIYVHDNDDDGSDNDGSAKMLTINSCHLAHQHVTFCTTSGPHGVMPVRMRVHVVN